MKNLIIIGAGGFGREVQWLVEEINQNHAEWNLLGFVDDNIPAGTIINGASVLGTIDSLMNLSVYAVCAIADTLTRYEIVKRISDSRVVFPILLHPDVSVSCHNQIGSGTIICKGVIMTVNINIGCHTIIDVSATIGHDTIIGDYCTILPSANISGNVMLSDFVSVGTGAQIIQGKSIGRNTIIGAGAVVVKDIPGNVVAVGVPAHIMKCIT